MLIKIVDMGIETRLGNRTENLEPGGHSRHCSAAARSVPFE